MEQSALCTNQLASLLDIKCGVRYQNVMQCLTPVPGSASHASTLHLIILRHRHGHQEWSRSMCVYINSRAWQTPGADSGLLHTIFRGKKSQRMRRSGMKVEEQKICSSSHKIQRKNSKNFCFSVCTCVHVGVDRGWLSGGFLCSSPPCILRYGPSLNLEFINWLQTFRLCTFHSLNLGLQAYATIAKFLWGSWKPTSKEIKNHSHHHF